MVVTGCTLPAWAMWVHIYVFIIFREHIKDLPIVLEEQTVALDETTVTAQRVVMEFDRQIIYPGKQEKETAMRWDRSCRQTAITWNSGR